MEVSNLKLEMRVYDAEVRARKRIEQEQRASSQAYEDAETGELIEDLYRAACASWMRGYRYCYTKALRQNKDALFLFKRFGVQIS